jgi:hypothetical protein
MRSVSKAPERIPGTKHTKTFIVMSVLLAILAMALPQIFPQTPKDLFFYLATASLAVISVGIALDSIEIARSSDRKMVGIAKYLFGQKLEIIDQTLEIDIGNYSDHVFRKRILDSIQAALWMREGIESGEHSSLLYVINWHETRALKAMGIGQTKVYRWLIFLFVRKMRFFRVCLEEHLKRS